MRVLINPIITVCFLIISWAIFNACGIKIFITVLNYEKGVAI